MVVGTPIMPWTVLIPKAAKTHLLASAVKETELPKYVDLNFSPKYKIVIIF